MGTAEATGRRASGSASRAAAKARRAAGAATRALGRTGETVRFRSAAEAREVLDGVLEEIDADGRIGPVLRATGLRMRMSFPDLALVLNLAASDERGHHLRWRFSDDVPWEPRLELTMDSPVANRYLQGRESLAIAIARGGVRCQGDARTALLYVPATRLIVDPYRRIVRAGYPHLAVD